MSITHGRAAVAGLVTGGLLVIGLSANWQDAAFASAVDSSPSPSPAAASTGPIHIPSADIHTKPDPFHIPGPHPEREFDPIHISGPHAEREFDPLHVSHPHGQSNVLSLLQPNAFSVFQPNAHRELNRFGLRY